MEIDSRPVEIDQLQRAVDRLRMEEMALGQEQDDGISRTARPAAGRTRRPHRAAGRAQRPLGSQRRPASTGSASSRSGWTICAGRPSGPSVTVISRLPRGCSTADIPAAEQGAGRGVREPTSAQDVHGQGGGHRRRRRRSRRRLDGHPSWAVDGGRDCQAAADGGRVGRACRRPARSCASRLRRRKAGAGGHLRPRPAHRLVPVPRTDRRRQDRSWPRRSPTSSSTTSARWCAST